MSTELEIREDQASFNAKQVAALRQMGVENASPADQAIFFHQCVRTGLDPFARQIYMIGRNAKNKRTNEWETKFTIQTGIDGYRLIARRAVDKRNETLGYEKTLWCGEDGQWVDVWLDDSKPPRAALVVVLRDGQPFPAVAKWSEYVQTDRDGKPNSMWARMKSHQLEKCAEAAALRKAFPQELSGLYTTDETGDDPEPVSAESATVTVVQPKRTLQRKPPPPEPILDPEPPADEPDPTGITDAQLRKIHATYNDLGVVDRDERLTDIAAVIGRDITSTNDLTRDEASRLIDRLGQRTPEPMFPEETA